MVKNNDIHNLNILTIYSTIAYVFAYLIVFLSYNIITALVGKFYDIQTILIHNKLLFITSDYSDLWNPDSAFYVFASGTLFLGIATFTFLTFYKRYQYREEIKKIFLFWITLHCINRALGSFIVGTTFHLYLSNVILYWLYVEYWIRIIMCISVSLLLFFFGSLTTKPLLLSTKSFTFVEKIKRHFFVLSQGIYPWFFSSIIIFLIHLPRHAYSENFLSFTMLILILPSYFNHQDIEISFPEIADKIENEIEYEEPAYKIPWKYIISILLFITLFRTVLAIGIAFY